MLKVLPITLELKHVQSALLVIFDSLTWVNTGLPGIFLFWDSLVLSLLGTALLEAGNMS